jgi:exosortase N
VDFKVQALRFQKPLSGIIPGLLLLFYVFMAIKLVWGYFLWDFTVFLGLALAPWICTIEKGKFSLRFLVAAILTSGTAVAIPVKTMLFLALLFTILLLIENFRGKVSSALFFLIILISPLFKYISDLISFPIRLWLSEVVAEILSGGGIKALSSGNIIEMNGYEFSVDQACAGLNMLSTSFIICLFIIAFYQKKANRQLFIGQVIMLLSLTFILNIGCNLLRILVLVLFKIMPGNYLHDLVGFLCLIVYVIMPLLFLSKVYFRKYGKTKQEEGVIKTSLSPNHTLRYAALHISLFILIISISFNLKGINKMNPPTNNTIKVAGFKKEVLENSVIKFSNKDALIYLKPTPFYAPEHNPMVCWKGSGYEFSRIKKEIVAGKEIYTGLLVKGKDKIYSTWWFDNGHTKTINQFSWRWEAAKSSSQFYLVNVNASDPLQLKKLVKRMISKRILLG